MRKLFSSPVWCVDDKEKNGWSQYGRSFLEQISQVASTGSVAVYFHPSWQQQASKVWSSLPVEQRERANESKPIQAKVVVHIPDNQKIPVTEHESDIELFIQLKENGRTT